MTDFLASDLDLGCLGWVLGIYIYWENIEWLKHKSLIDLLAQGDNSNPAFKFWLCHRLDAQLQANF